MRDEARGDLDAASSATGGGALAPTIYLVAIALAEVLTRAGNPVFGITLYAAILIVGLNHAAMTIGPKRALILAIAVVALERLLGIAVPLVPVGQIYRYVLVAVPTVIGIAIAARRVRYSLPDLGLVIDRRIVRVSLLSVPPGLALGFVYYWIAGPRPLIDQLRVADLLVPIVVLALTTGLVEEMLFRGLVQRAATRHLGRIVGVLYAGVLYAIVAALPPSVGGGAMALATALGLAVLTIKMGSVIPAAAVHASLNVALLLVAPFVLAGGS